MTRVTLLAGYLAAALLTALSIDATAQTTQSQPMPVGQQSAAARATIHVARRAVVRESARGDSIIIGSVDAGTDLEVVNNYGSWYEVIAPQGASWRRGWIHASALDLQSVPR